ANDACWYALASPEECPIGREMNLEHPPLGKWLIAAGVKAFGHTILGHRIVPVIFGVITIPLLYLLARRLLNSTLGASVATGLLAVDFLHLVLSRVAMLDVFLLFFSLLAFWFLLVDRDRRFGEDGERSRVRWLPIAAGAAAGAATASKWSGAFVIVAIATLALAWDIGARRSPTERHPVLKAIRAEGLTWLVAFLIVPVATYALTFVGRVEGTLLALPTEETAWLNQLWDRQVHIFRFHAHHVFAHRFASEPWSWPLAKRGIPFVRRPDGEMLRFVTAAGNPVVWTLSFVAVIYAGFRWIRNHGPGRPEGFIVAGFAWAYLPWIVYYFAPYLFFTWGRVALFIWYIVPVLPFMYLAMGYVAERVAKRTAGRVAVAAVTLFAVVAFAYYYPVLAYLPVSQQAFRARVALFDQCDPPPHAPFFFFERITEDGVTRFKKRTSPARNLLPPEGWCWL
ncbi:MAG TPA: glycosyltransferase family 39 protein, partial [Actinomycetota bacterium]|nr:glycosyltransferase family 39 protein [Actinomycetota bacterium]